MTTVDPLPALRTYLLSLTAVQTATGSRVYVGRIPRADTAAMPRKCALINGTGGPRDAGLVPIGVQRFDVRTYGASDLEAMAAFLAIQDALKYMPRHRTAGVLLESVIREVGPTQLTEPIEGNPEGWPVVFGVFQLTAAEAVAA